MPTETERPRFLEDLLAEVDAFDAELFKPNHPVSAETEDNVVGTLTPWLRKLYALGRYYSRQSKLVAVEREYESVEAASADGELCTMTYKHELLLSLLWGMIRSEYALWTAPSIGIRVDWQVVSSKAELSEEQQFSRFLSNFMGRKNK